MLIEKSSSIATAGAILLAAFLLNGCSSTTPALEQATQCPRPQQPDQRLTEPPCVYLKLDPEQDDPLAILLITKNNQCARKVREHYTELQRWIKEQQNHATE